MYVLEFSKHNMLENNNNVENNNNNNVEDIRENNCVHVRAVQESRVVLVCQHLFNCPRGKKNIYANVYQNTINDDDSQTSFSPIIFSEGRGVSVHRLLIAMILRHW